MLKRLLFVGAFFYCMSVVAFPFTALHWIKERATNHEKQQQLQQKESSSFPYSDLVKETVVEAYNGLITEADIWGLEFYENNTDNCEHLIKGYTKLPKGSDESVYWFLVCLEKASSQNYWGTLVYNGIVIELEESPWWWPL